jgi:hypothetical protein
MHVPVNVFFLNPLKLNILALFSCQMPLYTPRH